MPNTELALTWPSIAKFALTTGLATACLNQLFAWLKEERQRKIAERKSGNILALTLVHILTNYAQECNSWARSNRFASESGGYGSESIPELPPYEGSDAGWAALPSTIAAALKDFRNDVRDAVHGVEQTNEIYGPPEAINTATYRLVYLGYRACGLSTQLRKYYGFGKYSGDNTFMKELEFHYRKSNPGPISRFWESYPIYNLRRRIRRVVRKALPRSGSR